VHQDHKGSNPNANQSLSPAVLIIIEPRLSKTLANFIFTQRIPQAYYALCNITESVRGISRVSSCLITPWGSGGIAAHTFLNSVLDGVEWSGLCPSRLILIKNSQYAAVWALESVLDLMWF
jgi:hypothetical protein